MATIVNNPPSNVQHTEESGFNFIIGIVLLLLFLYVLFVYLIPAIPRGFGGTQVNVPSQLNVNLHQTK